MITAASSITVHGKRQRRLMVDMTLSPQRHVAQQISVAVGIVEFRCSFVCGEGGGCATLD
jgi:hypothetical protein